MKAIAATSLASKPLPAEWVRGAAWIEELMKLAGDGAIRFVRVTFAPGARTAWHTHPRGQILHVVAGTCRVQEWGGEISEFGAGDTVHIPPGMKHWHGASPAGVMVHLAMQQSDGEKDIEWLEHVD